MKAHEVAQQIGRLGGNGYWEDPLQWVHSVELILPIFVSARINKRPQQHFVQKRKDSLPGTGLATSQRRRGRD
jgi:hypothetical protein